MVDLSRRTILQALMATGPLSVARAQTPTGAPQAPPKFDFDNVVRRARDLATAPFEANPPPLPEALRKLDFDAWRDIRFRPDRAFLAGNGSKFRLQLFHLGHLYQRPVIINTIRDGIPTPIPYSAGLFDYGRTKLERPLPVNVGFAGFRLHYPLNAPAVYDELIAFVGASYFRFIGRGQRYGISARALATGAGTNTEEFPFFREFWIDTPEPNGNRATIYALLDSAGATGAYRFVVTPGVDSIVDVSGTLFPRRAGVKFGWAPLTSMFFLGENDHRVTDDYRPEVHDSDGLLIHSGTGEWIWRPLRNPTKLEVSSFIDHDIRGFGLLQRDRAFDHYQDLDLGYELRPNYWVEPKAGWGDGTLELVELPTPDETNDNIVASWVMKDAPDAGKPLPFAYTIISSLNSARLSPNGRTVNTFQTTAGALGGNDPVLPGSRRFIIDFSGGDLDYFTQDPSLVTVVPSTSQGKITRAFVMPNSQIEGFRAAIDVQLDIGLATDLRAFLRAGNQALTETWTYPWRAE
jgi:glucans biosynthesis protein